MKASELKPGRAIETDGNLFVITNIDLVKPGKGGAFAQCKLKNVRTGQTVDKRYRSNEEVNDVDLDRRELEYLYSDAEGAVFMDSETFEQITIDEQTLGDARSYLKPNSNAFGLFYQANPISIEMPAAVELEVTDTAPQVKGATATNQLKEAELESGLKTRVPPFITNGETIRVSTETSEYLGRA